MLNFYYNRICHLRIAQPIIKDINTLEECLRNYSRKKSISTLSYITLKYQHELDQLAIYMSARPVIKGEENSLYSDHTTEDLMGDLEYLISCLIIIGAVKYGVEKNIVDALDKINQQ